MRQVLVDTSALIAFFVRSEKHHPTIKTYLMENPSVQWVILSSVFDETLTWLRIKVSIAASIEIGHLLRNEHPYIVLSEEDDRAVWEIFRRYNDKQWSYTDCSLLAMAQHLDIPRILSFDHHIEHLSLVQYLRLQRLQLLIPRQKVRWGPRHTR